MQPQKLLSSKELVSCTACTDKRTNHQKKKVKKIRFPQVPQFLENLLFLEGNCQAPILDLSWRKAEFEWQKCHNKQNQKLNIFV